MFSRYLSSSVNHVHRSGLRYFSKAVPTYASSKAQLEIPQGAIIGREELLPNGEPYRSFQGIPYAAPPLGDLRFISPIPLERFPISPLDCTQERDECHQQFPYTKITSGSEDCLYLNVFAPAKRSASPLPVMVWIHGGAFTFGSSKNTIPLSLMCEDVIVVTLNYRLGAWGFLYMPEEGISNTGLKDQRLAIQWVHDNISHFNGDPNNITLFGESAGAASVHFHTLAPYARKLFHKAIIQSGSANMEWVFRRNQESKVAHLCSLLGFRSNNTREMLNFLKSPDKVKPMDILNNAMAILTRDEVIRGFIIPFRPAIEDPNIPDKFISTPVLELLQKKQVAPVPTMMGYTTAEGILLLPNIVPKIEDWNIDMSRFVPRNIPLPVGDIERKVLGEKIRDFYFNGQNVTRERLPELVNLLSDYLVNNDLRVAMKSQLTYEPPEPVYYYRYDYTGRRDLYKKYYESEHLPGACHADEVSYLFQMPGEDHMKFEYNDQRNVKRLSALWANFARHGNPTPPGSEIRRELGFNWTPVKRPVGDEDFVLDYFIIDRECKMDRNPHQERVEFWEEMYRQYPALDYSQELQ